MRWPWSSDSDRDNWSDNIHNYRFELAEPANLLPTVLICTTFYFGVRGYKRFLRRIPSVDYIKPTAYRKRSIFGRVTSVGDGDNFRLFHTPGGRLAGWGWAPGRMVPEGKELKGRTLSIRIAGIDAPETAHFGRPAQPYGEEALNWLSSTVLHRRIRAYIHRRDQYERVVATVYVRKWGIKRDVGLQMLKKGLATVYEAKTGTEFGGLEEKYRRAEADAKKRKIGMWAKSWWLRNEPQESPRMFKDRMKASEKEEKP